MGLALSPEVTALGEVSEFTRVKPHQHACTCGVVFAECRLWGELLQRAAAGALSTADFLRRAVERATELDSTRWCVDSVKNETGLAAECELGLGGSRLVYLVRHPCGYVYSQINCGFDFDYALDAWVYEQESALSFLARQEVASLTVRYEQLARNPARTLGEVADFVGVAGPFGERGTDWDWERARWGVRQHILCGAAWRLSGRPSVREDVRYKLALHPRARTKVLEICRPLLEKLGYDAEN